MPEFKTKKEVYERCVAEGYIIPRDKITLQKIKDSLQISEEDIEFLKKFKSKSTLTKKEALRFGAEVSKALTKRLKQKAR